eukprot:194937_1
MAQADDWDAASFANHNQYYNDQSTALFSQLEHVENRFRALREHLNGNIPHDIKANETEMDHRIEQIRALQNEIFRMQFKQFTIHEVKAKSKDKSDDPFDIKSKSRKKAKSNKEPKMDGDMDDIEAEEKKASDKQQTEYGNPFLMDDDDDNEDEKDDLKHDQYGKYQDILDSFEIEQKTANDLLKKLRATTSKMKELNDLALGKHRQHQ